VTLAAAIVNCPLRPTAAGAPMADSLTIAVVVAPPVTVHVKLPVLGALAARFE
jgi:hypothetical protein